MSGSDNSHEDQRREYRVARGSERSLGVLFAFILAVIGAWPMWDHGSPKWSILVAASVFLAAGLFIPKALRPLNIAWHQFGKLLERVVNPVIFGILFFLVVTPMGLLMRLLGKNPLALRFEPETKSYWIEREPPGPKPETMQDQF